MVYISRNGVIHETQPWGLARIKGIIMGFFNFLVMFFRTMLDFKGGDSAGRETRNGPGGSGGGGPPGGGPRRRPIGRTMTLADCAMPGGG